MNKQIEEMAKDIRLNMQIKPNSEEHLSHQLARLLVNDGYRKQKEGRWIVIPKRGLNRKRDKRINYETYTCAVCGRSNGKYKANYCPNCGAKMKEKTDD